MKSNNSSSYELYKVKKLKWGFRLEPITVEDKCGNNR